MVRRSDKELLAQRAVQKFLRDIGCSDTTQKRARALPAENLRRLQPRKLAASVAFKRLGCQDRRLNGDRHPIPGEWRDHGKRITNKKRIRTLNVFPDRKT